jgi:hypothetical protein
MLPQCTWDIKKDSGKGEIFDFADSKVKCNKVAKVMGAEN